MIPGSNETYRVTGSATISTDPELLKRFEVRGKPPRVVMVVAVDEAFNHCPKAFVRAKLWDAMARRAAIGTAGISSTEPFPRSVTDQLFACSDGTERQRNIR